MKDIEQRWERLHSQFVYEELAIGRSFCQLVVGPLEQPDDTGFGKMPVRLVLGDVQFMRREHATGIVFAWQVGTRLQLRQVLLRIRCRSQIFHKRTRVGAPSQSLEVGEQEINGHRLSDAECHTELLRKHALGNVLCIHLAKMIRIYFRKCLQFRRGQVQIRWHIGSDVLFSVRCRRIRFCSVEWQTAFVAEQIRAVFAENSLFGARTSSGVFLMNRGQDHLAHFRVFGFSGRHGGMVRDVFHPYGDGQRLCQPIRKMMVSEQFHRDAVLNLFR
mmetsp:Transcript_18427/g.52633  ORF Transcript_18427/g.52633 Transcript_18427/m.52633 type:complete len:274 (+) Transcript_18427:366-1187(+)